MSFHSALICENGHVISSYGATSQKYCTVCGKETVSLCPNCKASIRGQVDSTVVVMMNLPYTRPNFCHECGHPYPWTEIILDNAVELVALDDELDADSKELIKSAIPYLLVDSPAAPVAAAKYKKGLEKSSEFLKNALHSLLCDVFSEAVKKLLIG